MTPEQKVAQAKVAAWIGRQSIDRIVEAYPLKAGNGFGFVASNGRDDDTGVCVVYTDERIRAVPAPQFAELADLGAPLSVSR